MRCQIGLVVQGTMRMTASVGSRAGSLTSVFSTDAIQASSMKRTNTGGTGSVSLTVHGGVIHLKQYTGAIRAGNTACEGTEWYSETSARCLVGGALQHSRGVMVTAGDRAGSVTAALSMDASTPSLTRASNTPSSGSMSLRIHGSGFGPSQYTAGTALGPTQILIPLTS